VTPCFDVALPPEVIERNRELVAARLGWPAGALDTCRHLERSHPGWHCWWTPTPYPPQDTSGPVFGAARVRDRSGARLRYDPGGIGNPDQGRAGGSRPVTGRDRALRERNRALLAERLNWPDGALRACWETERQFPGWCAWWSRTSGYGASPATGPAIGHRTHYAPTAEALRTKVRQDIQRWAAERERTLSLRPSVLAAGAPSGPAC
jgi:hypothetical protein